MDLWVTDTPMWIKHGQNVDSKTVHILPTLYPHLRRQPVIHKSHTHDDGERGSLSTPSVSYSNFRLSISGSNFRIGLEVTLKNKE